MSSESPADRSARAKPRSISATIMVLMTVAMSLLFIGFALFHLSFAARTQRRDHEQYLTTMLQVVRAELEGRLEEGESEMTELAEIEDVVRRENEARLFGRLFLEIIDENGTWLLASEGVRELLSESPAFPPLADSPGSAKIAYWESRQGYHYVLAGFRVVAGSGRVRQVRIALDWTEAEHEVEVFRGLSVGVALVCTILAAIAAALVTRHALRPLTVIRDAAENIRQGSFEARLEPERLPVELSDLAHSFERMQEHLEKSFERLHQFAAELAHELRTPVNNLMGETEVALSKPRSPADYEEVLSSNLEEMVRLSRMIDSLLFLANAARRAAPDATEVLDLAAETDSVIEYHQAQADELGVTMTRKGTAILPGDRTLFRRALSNLLSNALQASSEGKDISITIEQQPEEVRVAVTDQGSGISPADLTRVFERFHRSQEARHRRPEGTGLGLSIVKSIVELHGGSVSVESEPGRGTTMTLTFPTPA